MRRRGHDRRSGPRTALACAAVCFLAIQLTVTLLLETRFPELRDPIGAWRMRELCDWRKEEPWRPRVVVIGSSRAEMGLRPGILRAAVRGEQAAPAIFNFAHMGAGPVTELILLQRVLRAGLRPNWLIVEVHPALLHQPRGTGESAWQPAPRMSFGELWIMRRFADRALAYCWLWLHARLVPTYDHRLDLMNRVAPCWQPWGQRVDLRGQKTDDSGWKSWMPFGKPTVTAEEYQRGLALAWQHYHHAFPDFHVSSTTRRAMHELLERCGKEGIHVLLLTMPEGTVFQSWYSAAARAEIDAYVTGLCREHGASWVDARSWAVD